MPPKPPLRLPAKPPIASKPHVKSEVPSRRAKLESRAPPLPQPTVASPTSKASPPRPPRPPTWPTQTRSRSGERYVKWGTKGVVVICAMLFVRDHYIEVQHVRGSSMAPTLSPDGHETGQEDYVLVRPYHERREKGAGHGNPWSVQRGDVVTFWKPHKPSEMGIKRVVAVEGDSVYPTRGYALDAQLRQSSTRVQGYPDGLADVDADSVVDMEEEEEEQRGKVVVPYGHVWIEGDNWRRSLDSNDFGPISKGLIQGKAVKVWRHWFRLVEVGDERAGKERDKRSRVVEGRSEVPVAFWD